LSAVWDNDTGSDIRKVETVQPMLFGIMEKKKTQESGNYETNAVWDNDTESDVSKV
jgi:hypothetical protein